jgi:hypothetical protein
LLDHSAEDVVLELLLADAEALEVADAVALELADAEPLSDSL